METALNGFAFLKNIQILRNLSFRSYTANSRCRLFFKDSWKKKIYIYIYVAMFYSPVLLSVAKGGGYSTVRLWK